MGFDKARITIWEKGLRAHSSAASIILDFQKADCLEMKDNVSQQNQGHTVDPTSSSVTSHFRFWGGPYRDLIGHSWILPLKVEWEKPLVSCFVRCLEIL